MKKKEDGKLVCLNCQKKFTPANTRQVYCSTSCRVVGFKNRKEAGTEKGAYRGFKAFCRSIGANPADVLKFVVAEYPSGKKEARKSPENKPPAVKPSVKKKANRPISDTKPVEEKKITLNDLLNERAKWDNDHKKSGGYDRRRSKLGF
jgi:hypothetical protein